MDAEPPAGRDVEAGGVRLRVAELGSGRPTVLLHGGGPGCTAWTDFGPVADRLARGRRLIFVDLPQYGASEAPAITGPAVSFHAARVLGVLDALGVARADFACQSLGGSVALALAARHPDRAGRLVVTGSQPVPAPCGVRSDTALGLRARAAYYGGDGPAPEKMRALIAELEWHDPSGLPERTVLLRHEASTTPAALDLAADPGRRGVPEDLTADLTRVRSPVLLLWGEHDPFAGPAYAQSLAARLPRADVAVLGRTAHHPAEERPAAYAALAAAHLDGALP
ncbi:alpha/beta fold hydrolase [Actinomadura rugatobispora]|uniref:Alpha/beta fold hydrolase n=1 Tax=Actinomadura rugatobispora TaxID=1994 RepID=A0ABW1AI75_9ACTN|nr:alpha/beta fold hydrolase [Actinomadura rugatobispora]